MWSTIFISITSHILRTFYFKFSIIYTQSSIIQFLYHFYFFCIFHMKEGCHCSLVERLEKVRKIFHLLSFQFSTRLSKTTYYLDYWELKENVVLLQEQRLCYPFSCFFFKKIPKRKYLKSFFFIEKSIEGEMGNPKTRQFSAYLIYEKRQIFQSALTVCIRV